MPKGTTRCPESHALDNWLQGAVPGVSPPHESQDRQLPSHSAALSSQCPKWGPPGPRSPVTQEPLCPWPLRPAPARTRGRGRRRRGTVPAYLPTLLLFLRSSESTVGTAADSTAPGLAESYRASQSTLLARGPGPLWSPDHVLTWTSPGWRVLRKSLHLAKPPFPHCQVGSGADSMS